MSLLHGVLTLYCWIGIGATIVLLIQIARFYRKKWIELHAGVTSTQTHVRTRGRPTDKPQHRTFHGLFVVPLVLFVFAAGRYAWSGDLAGDIPGDLALLTGGVVLALSSYYLYQLMTGRRN
jgi:hypothetical protein